MTITEKQVVTLTYELRNASGDLVDSAASENPFEFIHHIGMTLPEFDKNLKGLRTGDEFNFVLSAEDGYGEKDEEAIVEIPLSVFSGEDLPEDLLSVGNVVPMQDQEGNALNGKILAMDAETLTMDFNHPLAGSSLHFTGRILNVREATPQEIEHGHVHTSGHDH